MTAVLVFTKGSLSLPLWLYCKLLYVSICVDEDKKKRELFVCIVSVVCTCVQVSVLCACAMKEIDSFAAFSVA